MTSDPALRSRLEELQKQNVYVGDAIDVIIEEFPDYEDEAADIVGAFYDGNSAPPTQEASIVQDHVTAPFRFVPLNDNVVPAQKDVTAAYEAGTLHRIPLTKTLSGQIGLTIEFDNSVLIGGTDTQQNKPVMIGKNYVLPGSSIKGLTRAAMEIVCFARMSQTNTHRRYAIRMFGHTLMQNNVRAGWLSNHGTDDAPDWKIAPCEWRPIRIRDLKPDAGGKFHLSWLKKSLLGRYQDLSQRNKNECDFNTSATFAEYQDQQGNVMVRPDPNGNFMGIYVVCNKSPTTKNLKRETLDAQDGQRKKGQFKKTEAVFATNPSGRAFDVPKAIRQQFLDANCSFSEHKPKPVGNWKDLSPTFNVGARIPVFWTADSNGEITDFGLTRTFKRAHDYTVGDVLRCSSAKHLSKPGPDQEPDMVEALFGFVHEPDETGDTSGANAKDHAYHHLKSRLSFGFAWLDTETPAKLSRPVTTIQAQPKPSFAPFYLAGDHKDWTDTRVTLAGRKRYPVRGATTGQVNDFLRKVPGAENAHKNDAGCELMFLVPKDDKTPLRFRGEIRFRNVTPVELGAVLWVLETGGDPTLRHLFGRAKASGAGQARITADLHDGTEVDKRKAIAAFIEYMSGAVSGWQNSPQVRGFLASCNPAWAKGKRLKYLGLTEHGDLRKATYGKSSAKRLLGF